MLIYLSFATSDKPYGEELQKRLAAPAFRERYRASCWCMQQAAPGTNGQLVMAEKMAQADIFVPLISADFLADSRCYAEFLDALRLKEGDRLGRIVPIIVRPTALEGSPVLDFSCYPRTKQNEVKALSSWKSRDEAWISVVQGIGCAVTAIRASRLGKEC